MSAPMDVKQGTDLERRLAARLQPARVLGAEETWARIAPALDAGGPGRWRALPVLGIVIATGLVVAMAGALVVMFQETSTGGMGSQPGALTATAERPMTGAGSAAAVGMGTNRNLITGLVPPPPFAVFQPAALPGGMQLIATAYNPASREPNQRLPAVSGGGATIGGTSMDPALVQGAAQRSQELLGDGSEAALVLIYAAGPDDQIELVQRSAAGKSLPAGDPLTVHGLPATMMQRDGRTVVTWIEAATFLELAVTAPTDERLRIADSLHQTALIAPDPAAATPAVNVAAGGNGVPAAGAGPLPKSAPLSQRRGAVSVPQPDRAAIAQQCGAWDPSLYQVYCTARIIAGIPEGTGYGVSRFTWSKAAEQLGLDPAIGPSGDPLVWLVTLDPSGGDGRAVVLDAETGKAILLVELLPVP